MSILLGSKLRRKLLTYSFTHPDEYYYVRELASIINEDAGNLSRELRKFEEEYPQARVLFLYRGKEKLKKGDILCLPCEKFLKTLLPGKPLTNFS